MLMRDRVKELVEGCAAILLLAVGFSILAVLVLVCIHLVKMLS